MSGEASQVAPGAAENGAAQSLVFELPAKPAAGYAARHALLAHRGALPSSVRDNVLLLVTELVSNAVRHAQAGADQMVRVELRHRARTVSVAVFDAGSGFTAEVPRVRPDQTGGWGLFLLDRIADRWAITSTASGTCASFEIGCEQ
jgi:anti-sigma regulatory factor (Ser/Thr protein kinase)